MPSQRACAFDGCDKRADGLYCSGHAAQKRNDRELAPLRIRGVGPALCAFNGCPLESFVNGYCLEHARQFERGEELRPTSVLPEQCSFPGCIRQRYGKLDLCTAHNQQKNKGQKLRPLYEHLIKPDAVCKAMDGCQHRVYSLGYCRTHHAQFKSARPFTILAPPTPEDQLCTAEKCGREVEPQQTLCRPHTLMALRGESLTRLKVQTNARETEELLRRGVYWCTICQQELPLSNFPEDGARKQPRARCKLCVGIETRSKKFGVPFIDIYRLFEFQGFRCAICPTMHDHELGLHLDHDHACCPGKGQSCGKCIRGLLCFSCNGAVISWYERIRLVGEPYAILEEYLSSPPALQLGIVGR